MKKKVLGFIALCLSIGAAAQVGDIPSDYWTKFEANYELYDSWWDVDNQTTNVTALTGLTPTNGMKIDESSISNNAYTITTDGDVFKVHYKKTTSYEKFGLSWMEWAYPESCESDNWQLVNPITGEKWANDCHRTAKGYSIDFSDPANRIVYFKYQALSDATISLRVDLWDIKGRKTTKEGYICTDDLDKVSVYSPTDEKAWQEFMIIYADYDEDEDVYNELAEYVDGLQFFGNCAGILQDGNNTWWNGIQFSEGPSFGLTLDEKNIIGLEVYINCDKTTKDEEYDLYIKDLTVGNTLTRDATTEFVGIPTITNDKEVEIKDGIVYSEGDIEILNILGQVVASGKKQLDVKTLPSGIFFIKTAEGTAKFVK